MFCSYWLMISQHWFRQWLGAVRHQVITWTNVDLDLCQYMVPLGHYELRNDRFIFSISGVTALLKRKHHHKEDSLVSELSTWVSAVRQTRDGRTDGRSDGEGGSTTDSTAHSGINENMNYLVPARVVPTNLRIAVCRCTPGTKYRRLLAMTPAVCSSHSHC